MQKYLLQFLTLVNNITSDVACPPLFPPKHGYLECSRPVGIRIINRPGTQCVLKCPLGYRVINNFSKICGADGKWKGDDEGICSSA